MFNGINNKDALATTELRRKALDILEAGYEAIDTQAAIESSVSVSDSTLTIGTHSFSLEDVDNVYVIGIGKASCEAARALESILGSLITSGVVIDVSVEGEGCERIQEFEASHPTPTEHNVTVAQHIVDLAEQTTERDLVIVAISGGGSSLLCWPESEYTQGVQLYKAFLEVGGTIQELNTIRKHISGLKGGGLASRLYPATVMGLIFSDVPGGELSDVASGPTFFDDSTVDDARAILSKYDMDATFDLEETPKDETRFKRVYNIPLVTNENALQAMKEKAQEMELSADICSPSLYEFAPETVDRLMTHATRTDSDVVLGGGEIRLVVDKEGGSGGRNLYLANEALLHLSDNDVFIAAASDGIDNCEDAGGIADRETKKRLEEKALDPKEYKERFDSHTLFKKAESVITTGSTGANVADLMIYIKQ